jgi:hypothetical protein
LHLFGRVLTMAHSYKFAIIRLAPDDGRGERLNVGAVIFNDRSADIRIPPKLDKLRALSAAANADDLRSLIDALADVDARFIDAGLQSVDQRYAAMAAIPPLQLSPLGTFTAQDAHSYEARVQAVLKTMVHAEPALKKIREKRSKLLVQVKSVFRHERVLAKKDEDLSSHRIVPSFELDEGLVADLVLRNGAFHVVETVDASGEEDSLRKAIAEVGIAALVLERARMRFGAQHVKTRLVYNASATLEKIARPSFDAAANQGAELVNWASADERNKFVHSMAQLATPVPNRRRHVKFAGPRLAID